MVCKRAVMPGIFAGDDMLAAFQIFSTEQGLRET